MRRSWQGNEAVSDGLPYGVTSNLGTTAQADIMRARQIRGWKLALLGLTFVVAVRAYPQTYQVQVMDSSEAAVDQSSNPAMINPSDSNNYPMPTLHVAFTNNSSCTATVTATITITWTDNDPADPTTGCGMLPFPTKGTVSNSNIQVPAKSGSTWNLAPTWLATTAAAGGSADLTWTVNGTQQTDYKFNILQQDPTEAEVDAAYSGAPWFYGSMINEETQGGKYGRQACASGVSFCSANYPMVSPDPDGIGIGQDDGCQNTPTTGTYWNYESNISQSLSILKGKASESQTNWTTNYGASGDTDPTPYDSKLPSYAYCQFEADTLALGNYSFGDADWIQDYNTHSTQHWYLWWDATLLKWDFKYNTSDKGSNYVPSVCGYAPY